ncbi:MAG: hypothetical protein IJ940_02665, partial [Bacteroidales bacterium]|nr:hypothetical protein [Bacteroidales bacterium]
KAMGTAYLLSGIMAMALMIPLLLELPVWALSVPVIYLILHIRTWRRLVRSTGAALNPVLGTTARNLLIFSVLILATLIIDMIINISI